jgi:hypothetical protein
MSAYEIASLRLDYWLLVFTGIAASANAIVLFFAVLNIRWLAKQVVVQQGSLKQQILASEVSLLIHEKSLIDPKSGIDAQSRFLDIERRLSQVRDEIKSYQEQ